MDSEYEIISDDRKNGGNVIITMYFDSDGKACKKKEASKAIIEESDKDGTMQWEGGLQNPLYPISGQELHPGSGFSGALTCSVVCGLCPRLF